MAAIDLPTADWLAHGAAGALAAAERAMSASPGNPAAAASALARIEPGLTPEQRATALAQVTLRAEAGRRYGFDAGDLLLTREGLEQATRPEVAHARVRMLGLAPRSRVLDATAGLGFDTRAFIGAGAQVTAVERDPGTATLLAANAPGARVINGDITDPEVLERVLQSLPDLVYIDPARRSGARSIDGGRARPERDPQRWSPPWSFVLGLADRLPVCAKVSPGFAPRSVPEGWQAAWLAIPTGPVEACLVSQPLLPASRRACLVTGDAVEAVDDDGQGPASCRSAGAYLHEPAQVVVNAGLIDALARRTGLERLAMDTHWLTSTEPINPGRATGLLASYRVLEVLPTAPKSMRAALRARGITDLTIKSRGNTADAQAWRARLAIPEGPSATLVIAAISGATRAYLVQRCA